jgi:hypothetical protein
MAASLALEARFDEFANQVEAFVQLEGEHIMDAALAIRFSMSFLLGIALVDGYFFATAAGHPDKSWVLDQMTDFLLRAVGHSTA